MFIKTVPVLVGTRVRPFGEPTNVWRKVASLVMTNIAIENGHRIFVDFPIENGDLP